MSRSGYVDADEIEDYRLVALYRGRVTSAIRGKRGQRLIKDAIAVLDAMPEKRLAYGWEQGGCHCTLGAVTLSRGLDEVAEKMPVDPYDWSEYYETPMLAKALNVAPCVISEIIWENDESGNETPEARWSRMRAWLQSQLSTAKAQNGEGE